MQYSPFCLSAMVLTLGGDDIEDGVPDREQGECEREKVEEGERTGERQTRRDETRSNM